jgi:hypothetical protein
VAVRRALDLRRQPPLQYGPVACLAQLELTETAALKSGPCADPARTLRGRAPNLGAT